MRLRIVAFAAAVALAPAVATRHVSWAGGQQPVVDTTITIRAVGSTLEWVPVRISARTGKRIRLRLVNDGTLPHNLVVPKNEDDIETLGAAAYNAAETGYVPVADRAKMLGYTTLASPGQTVDVTFVMPAPGEYRYICLFPGHSNSMLGTLRSLR